MSQMADTIAAHRSPSIDPGSDRWQDGMGDAMIEEYYATKALPLQPTGHLP